MAEDRIDSIVDLRAIQTELDLTEAGIDQLIAKIRSVKANNVSIMDAKTVSEFNAANKELQKNIDLTNKSAKAAIDATKAKAQEAKLTKDLTNEHKLLSLAVKDAQIKYHNLAITLGRNHPLALQAKADALALKASLVQLNQDVGVFNDNVGNYGKSATGYFGNLKKSAAGAFQTIKTAANIIPGLGLSGAFLLLFQGIGFAAEKVGEAFSNLSEKSKSLASQKRFLNEVNKEAVQGYVQEVTHLTLVQKKLDDLSIPQKDRIKLAEDYNKTADEGNKIDISQIDNINLVNAAIGRQIEKIKQRATAKAAENILTQKEQKVIEGQLDLQKELDKRGFHIDVFDSLFDPKQLQIDFQKGRKKIDYISGANLSIILDDLIKNKRDFEAALKVSGSLISTDDLIAGNNKTDKEKKGRDIAEANRKAVFEIEKTRLQFIIDTNNKIASDNQNHLQERLEAASVAYGAEQELIIKQGEFEKKEKGKTAKEKQKIDSDTFYNLLKSDEKFNEAILKANEDWNKRKIDEDKKWRDIVEKMNDDELKKYLDGIEKKKKALKELADIAAKLREKIKKENEQETRERIDLEKQLATELRSLTLNLINGQIERKKEALDEELRLIDRNREREVELAGNNAARVAEIEARAAAAKESIERRRRQLDIKKAQFDKLNAIAQIVQNTAIAITANAKFPALIPLVIAIGAAQLASVIAQPIPKYKQGTQRHEGGLAIVGDGGKAEGITLPDGTVLKTPATSTLVDIPAGSKVHPDFSKMMLTATMTKPVEFAAKTYSDSSAKVVSELKEVKKAIYKIPQTNIEVTNPIRQRIRYGHSINHHLTRNLGR